MQKTMNALMHPCRSGNKSQCRKEKVCQCPLFLFIATELVWYDGRTTKPIIKRTLIGKNKKTH